MSIANETEQAAFLALGDRVLKLTIAAAPVPADATGDESAAALGQVLAMAALGQCEKERISGAHFVHGVGYAIGSLLAQLTEPVAVGVFDALSRGVERGQIEAHREFNTGGRA